MTITTMDGLANALANNNSRLVIDKAYIANTAAGQYHSLWRATGQPGQGAIPTTAETCNHNTTGAMGFTQQTAPATSYLGYAYVVSNAWNAMTFEIHDRLAAMGGLSGIVTTAQTVSLDLNTLGGTDNVSTRKGDDNFSDVRWWLEWYTDTGATAVNATVNVTFNDGTSNNLSAISLAATRRASFLQPLNGFIQAADAGKYIRAVNSVTLSATTGTAGNFGVTATRPRGTIAMGLANWTAVANWQDLGLPEIFNSSCLMMLVLAVNANTGALRGGGKVIHG